MKKRVMFLLLVLVLPCVKASIFDWLTGRATEEAPITEQVKCIFSNSAQNDCFTSDGRFKCSGTGSCFTQVSGNNGEILTWKSSCGGEVSSITDGSDSSIEFKCPEMVVPSPVESSISEQVKCNFLNSNSMQKCYANDGKFSCTGVGECLFQVSGEKGTKLSWKSSCEGLAETIIDGVDENLEFRCQQVQTCTDSDGGKNYQLKGTVKNQNSESTDYCNSERTLTEYFCQDSGDGKPVVYTETHPCDYGCNNGACLQAPIPVCGNGLCESEDEKANCPKDCIKCYKDSDCGQSTTKKSCGSPFMAPAKGLYPDSNYACTSETRYICENPGTTNSRCGGGGGASCIPCPQGCKDGECLTTNPTTVKEPVPIAQTPCTDLDGGRNYGAKGYIKTQTGEHAEDVCESEGYLNEYYCVDDKIYSDRIMCPYGCKDGACLQHPVQIAECIDSDATNIVTVPNGVLHPPGEDRYLKGSVTYGNIVYKDYCTKIIYYTDSLGNKNMKFEKSFEGTGVIEEGCLDGKKPYETSYFECPMGCKEGACIKEEITEQIKCIFSGSDKDQQCYIAGSFTGADEGTKFCKGRESCIINYTGNKNQQTTWKSTCGGYQYTTQDGNNKEIIFTCAVGETNFAEIENKGFRFAYWQCYDGSESRSEDITSCKASETWQKYASEFCKGKCYKDRSKCGVNSFSVWNECYTEGATAIPIPTTVPTEPNAAVTVHTQGTLYYFFDDNCPHCKDMDKEIGMLKQKGFFNNFGAVVYNTKDMDISQKYEIKAVPTLILYKDKCIFRKEGFMKSDEIERWAYNAKCGELIEEANKIITEPMLVCKDSCPFDGKCYPFGYRKTGKYCSDEGNFKSQLDSDKACDNNFECSSNICVDSKCVSSALIDKIFDWLRKLFG